MYETVYNPLGVYGTFISRRRKLFKCVSNFCYDKASLLVRTRAIQKTFIMPGPSLTLVGMTMVTLTLVVTLAGSEHRPSRCEVAAWHPSEENVRHADLEDAGVGKPAPQCATSSAARSSPVTFHSQGQILAYAFNGMIHKTPCI